MVSMDFWPQILSDKYHKYRSPRTKQEVEQRIKAIAAAYEKSEKGNNVKTKMKNMKVKVELLEGKMYEGGSSFEILQPKGKFDSSRTVEDLEIEFRQREVSILLCSIDYKLPNNAMYFKTWVTLFILSKVFRSLEFHRR